MDPAYVEAEFEKFYHGMAPSPRVLAELKRYADELGVDVQALQSPDVIAKHMAGKVDRALKEGQQMRSKGEFQSMFGQADFTNMSTAERQAEVAKALGIEMKAAAPMSALEKAKLTTNLAAMSAADPRNRSIEALQTSVKNLADGMKKQSDALTDLAKRPVEVVADISMDGNKVAKGVMNSKYMEETMSTA